MKKILLLSFFYSLALSVQSQVIWEDFEDGGKLQWVANDGVYNGIVANPDTTGINKSTNVGSYTKGANRAFSLFRVQRDMAFDISENNIFRMQVWSPVATEVLLKLEGGGNAVEARRPIRDSVWTELTYDFRSKASAATMTDLLIFFSPGNDSDSSTYLFDNITAAPLPESLVLEDFENGARLNWMALDGTYSGIVENPDTAGINSSTNVGSYTKSGMHAFSLFLHSQSVPIDLSLFNKVSIQIYSPVKTDFLLKFEGSGEAREVRAHIASTNVWREYVLDFSAAANFTTINKIIIFFDPGNESSEDTYLFDNLILYPSDECAGTVPLAGVVDNFECQRNAAYDNGWDRLSVVDNPDLSLANGTAKVGKYSKPANEEWAALVADYQNPIDLSTLNVLTAKVWSPVAGRMLFKLEGGASPAKEIGIDIPQTNTWVDYQIDFSDFATENHRRLVFFFAAGTAFPNPTDFFIDEIIWTEKSDESSILEDFEEGGKLAWFPTDNNPENGTFTIIENPVSDNANNSTSVGSYARGSRSLSSLSAVLLEPLDLSEFTQLNIQIYAPEGASSVTMQLVSPLEGSREVTRDIPAVGEWTTVSFDFASSAVINDFSQINLIFDGGSSITGTYYLDNLSLGETTVDPCEGIAVIERIVDDFECQRNATITLGAADIEVAPNPDISQGNNSTIVGKYTEPEGQWASLLYEFDGPVDLTFYNQLSIKIRAPRVVPMLFKLEGGSGPVKEIFMDVTEPNKWITYNIDFSSAKDLGHNKLVLFMNAGQDATPGEVYYWDDIRWALAPFESCIANFEGEPFDPAGWIYFSNGVYADSTVTKVPNPLKEGVNTSDNVARFVEAAGAPGVDRWAGIFLRGETPINFTDPNNQKISMDILMDHAATVVFKLESGTTTNTTGDIIAQYTTPNEWQTVTWDYSSFPNDQYKTIALILDFDNIPTEDKVYYFDNIRVAGTNCDVTTGILDFEALPSFSVFPNPANNSIRIETPSLAERIEVYNALGQKMENRLKYQPLSEIDVEHYLPGLYFLQVFDQSGKISGHARFIKQ